MVLVPLLRMVAALLMSAQLTHAGTGFICGTQDEVPGLAKTAELPSIPKVYSGVSKAVVVRIAYKDAPYKVSDSSIAEAEAEVDAFFLSMSRNGFHFDFKVHPEIWTAPGTRASYGKEGFSGLQTFIRSKVKAAGYVKGSNYDVLIANFPDLDLDWSGMSDGSSGGNTYINGGFKAAVIGHELGHAVGLPHAGAIEPCPPGEPCDATDIFGTPGTRTQNKEYGNLYDIMGDGDIHGHFNINYKWRLGWIDREELLEVSHTGTYRVYAQDNSTHRGRLVGLKIPSSDPRYAYWLEYRSQDPYAKAGAAVMFQGFLGATSRNIHLLDATPQSRASRDALDAVLIPGKQIKDKYGTASIKVLAIDEGMGDGNGWVDVQVTIPGTANLSLGPDRRLHLGSGFSILRDVLGRSLEPGAGKVGVSRIIRPGGAGEFPGD